MIVFDVLSPTHWVIAGLVTAAAMLVAFHLLGLVAFVVERMLEQDYRMLAHRLERWGIDLAEQAGLVWPWPPSELERLRTTIAVLDTMNIQTGDRFRLASSGEAIRVMTVAMGRLGVTAEQATRGLRALAKAWNAWHDATTPGRQAATGKPN